MNVISSICQNPILRVSALSSFVVSNTRGHLGFVQIAFSVHNTSGIRAMRPFIAFPPAGLQFVACADWTTGHFLSDSGRRMIRFLPKSGGQLGAGQTAMPCILQLPVARSGGGSLILGRGVEKQLSELSDLRVFAITGAGNFAPERISLVIPGKEIRATIWRSLPQTDVRFRMALLG